MVDISKYTDGFFDDWVNDPDAPSGMDGLMEWPIQKVAMRLGQSINRLYDFLKLEAPDFAVNNEIKIAKERLGIIRLRSQEFIDWVNRIDTRNGFPDEYIVNHITEICAGIVRELDRRDKDDPRKDQGD